MRAGSVVGAVIDEVKRTVTFNVVGEGSLVLSLDAMSDETRAYAALHGMKQRVSDAAAIPFRDGKYATPGEKYAAMRALVEHYNGGAKEWARHGGGEKGPRVSGETDLIIRALAELYGRAAGEQRDRLVNIVARRKAEPKGKADETLTLRVYVAGVLETARASGGAGRLGGLVAIYERLRGEQPAVVSVVDPEDLLRELESE